MYMLSIKYKVGYCLLDHGAMLKWNWMYKLGQAIICSADRSRLPF